MDEWIGNGSGQHEGAGYVTNEKAHRGQYSWKAVQNSSFPPPFDKPAKLLRWRFDYKEAYFSAWYFWPSIFNVTGRGNEYVNIFQWLERNKPWGPTWIIAVMKSYQSPGKDELVVHNAKNNLVIRKGIILPKEKWFNLQAFMKTEFCCEGKLIVYLDGQEIFNLPNINTSGSPTNTTGFLMWGVGNYSASGSGEFFYIDDTVVSARKVMDPPRNLVIK